MTSVDTSRIRCCSAVNGTAGGRPFIAPTIEWLAPRAPPMAPIAIETAGGLTIA